MILIHPKKIILISVIIFELIGCTSIGSNTTYYMGAVSFNYNPAYASYMVKLNGTEVGGGYGRSMNTSPVKIGT